MTVKKAAKKRSEIESAVRLLREYNAWRRGSDEVLSFTPAEIGHAIESVCRFVESRLPK